MKNAVLVLSLAVLFGAAGCHGAHDVLTPAESVPEGAMIYTAYDETGAPVATGWVKLDQSIPTSHPTSPMAVTGTWALRSVGDRPGTPPTGEGPIEGTVADGALEVGFQPHYMDYNAYARGAIEIGGVTADSIRWDGTWEFATIAGPQFGGTFRARR